ncbi:MAG TPA: hypothetical protein VMG12_36900 [Polyangiaceae bacterium]|nr:hypothetical protein [Polyangiaceae bacterium]
MQHWIARSAHWFGLIGALNCTLLSNFDSGACDSDVDCQALGETSTYCEAGRCLEGCRDNHQCFVADSRFPLCNRSLERCVALASPEQECTVSSGYDDASMGEASVDELTILGAFAPTLESSSWLTLQLAALEIRQSPLATSDGLLAPLMLVLCDDAPDQVSVAMTHLVRDLKARAAVASFDDAVRADAIAASNNLAFLLSPDGRVGSPLTELSYHLGGDYSSLVPLYSTLFDSLSRLLPMRSPARPYRAAILIGSEEDDAIARIVREALVLDGLRASTLVDHDRLRSYRLEAEAEARVRAASDLVSFAPDVVFVFTSGVQAGAQREERARVLGTLEEQSAAMPDWSPLYVIGPRRAGDTYVDSLARVNPSFRSRAISVAVGMSDERESAALRTRFATQFPRAAAPQIAWPSPGLYDAFYYLAYAAAAGRERGALGPEQFISGMTKVTDPAGAVVHVGPGSEGLALGGELLRAGKAVDLHGITGSGPFDRGQRLRSGAPAAYCWKEDGSLAPWRPAGGTDAGEACASEFIDERSN